MRGKFVRKILGMAQCLFSAQQRLTLPSAPEDDFPVVGEDRSMENHFLS